MKNINFGQNILVNSCESGPQDSSQFERREGWTKKWPINESVLALGINSGGYLIYNIFSLKVQHKRDQVLSQLFWKQSLTEFTFSRNLSIVISFCFARDTVFVVSKKNIQNSPIQLSANNFIGGETVLSTSTYSCNNNCCYVRFCEILKFEAF